MEDAKRHRCGSHIFFAHRSPSTANINIFIATAGTAYYCVASTVKSYLPVAVAAAANGSGGAFALLFPRALRYPLRRLGAAIARGRFALVINVPVDERADRIGKMLANIFMAALAALFLYGYLRHFL
jgi:hypothetical protein